MSSSNKRPSPSPSSPPAKRSRLNSSPTNTSSTPIPTSHPTHPSSSSSSSSAPAPPLAASPPTTQPISLHSWLHPSAPPLLRTHSPPLHAHTSTFQSFTISYTPPSHITSESALAKDVRRIVRELDVPSIAGPQLMRDNDGAFQDGEGRRRVGGKERVREPDHRMWACRAVILKEGKDGTRGEDDYQLMECFNDDGEKFGGDRALRVLKEHGGVDVISVCCRWYGGDMLGPIRFQHIGTTVQTSLTSLQKLVKLTDLRSALVELDAEVASLRETISMSSTTSSQASTSATPGKLIPTPTPATYDDIDDTAKLERLLKARERTRESLQGKAAWTGMQVGRAGGE